MPFLGKVLNVVVDTLRALLRLRPLETEPRRKLLFQSAGPKVVVDMLRPVFCCAKESLRRSTGGCEPLRVVVDMDRAAGRGDGDDPALGSECGCGERARDGVDLAKEERRKVPGNSEGWCANEGSPSTGSDANESLRAAHPCTSQWRDSWCVRSTKGGGACSRRTSRNSVSRRFTAVAALILAARTLTRTRQFNSEDLDALRDYSESPPHTHNQINRYSARTGEST